MFPVYILIHKNKYIRWRPGFTFTFHEFTWLQWIVLLMNIWDTKKKLSILGFSNKRKKKAKKK